MSHVQIQSGTEPFQPLGHLEFTEDEAEEERVLKAIRLEDLGAPEAGELMARACHSRKPQA